MPPVQGSVEVRATVILTEEIHTIIGRVARCGVNTLLADSRVKFFLHVSLPLAACPHFPPLPLCLSVYCIQGGLRDTGLRTRLVIIRRILLSLLLKSL